MPQQEKRCNGNGPRQTYHQNKPKTAPHPTTFIQDKALTQQWQNKQVENPPGIIPQGVAGIALQVAGLVTLRNMVRP